MRCQHVAALAFLAAALASQQPQAAIAHGDIRTDKDGLVLPAGEFTVAELIEATATYLCRNYLYDFGAVERAGSFRLQRAVAVDALGSEELLYALLSTRGFAVLPIDELRGLYGIIALDAQGQAGQSTPALPSPWRHPDEILLRPALREIAYTHVVLQHVDARDLAQMLRQMTAPSGWRPGQLLAAAGNQNSLMLHGYRDQIAGAVRLARHIDSSLSPAADRILLERVAELERRIAELEKR